MRTDLETWHEKRHGANGLFFYRFTHFLLAPSEEKITETKDCCIKATWPEKKQELATQTGPNGDFNKGGGEDGKKVYHQLQNWPKQGMPYTQAHKRPLEYVLNETLQTTGNITEENKPNSILNLFLYALTLYSAAGVNAICHFLHSTMSSREK